MEPVSVKFQSDVLRSIDRSISRHSYNSRTEFIRDAVRDKLEALHKEELVREFLSLRGKAEARTSLKEDKEIREQVSKELLKRLDRRFRSAEA